MTDDLVKRLRSVDISWSETGEWCAEAADRIEQHEAFRQEVSDALYVYQKADSLEERSLLWDALTRFIIAKPDPLVEVLTDLNWAYDDIGPKIADDLREALAKRGGKIVWEND